MNGNDRDRDDEFKFQCIEMYNINYMLLLVSTYRTRS